MENSPFEKFVGTELPKRISTNENPLDMTAGKIPVSSGLGLGVIFVTPTELALAAGSFSPLQIIPAAGAALELDVDPSKKIAAYDITLNKPNCALTLLNATVPEGYLWSIAITLRQGSGANKVTWPVDIVWAFNRKPALSYDRGAVDLISLISDPVTGKWRGMVDGGWFNG